LIGHPVTMNGVNSGYLFTWKGPWNAVVQPNNPLNQLSPTELGMLYHYPA
jgi:hypothetical protein